MKGALNNSGSESKHDEAIAPSPEDDVEATHSQTQPYVAPDQFALRDHFADKEAQGALPGNGGGGTGGESVDENEQTIISNRPVAAPEDFYRSMPLPELAQMLEGRQLDHFGVEQMIGGGGMGAVFRGTDQRLDRTVAIKVIPGSKRDPETLRRFRLEAQAAARLDHPNIARVYYVGEAEQWNYIVFEFIDGVNIRDLVSMEGPLQVDDAVYYTRQVAEALQHAHERDVVHRDIKPSNILVTAGGMAKVVDMGLARNTALDQSAEDATSSGVTLGTFDYISPEQARNPRDADVRSDLYSLGCTLFYMLTGHAPFPEGTALQKLLNHGSVPPPDPRGWRDDLSDQLYAILMKLMAKQPANRYQKPAELVNDLMLLAEIEDLPRSQAPGSIVMTPAGAQRSLLESNLPWMVAFAFLLGSTLWFQSMQAISPGIRLPELNLQSLQSAPAIEENQNVEGQLPVNPDEERLPSGDDTPTERSTSQNEIRFVVSEYPPTDVDIELWEEDVYSALERVAKDQTADIEIRGKVVLDRPLTLDGVSVHLHGERRDKAEIELSPGLLADLPDWKAAFSIQSGTLRLSDVSLVANVDLPTNRTRGLILLAGPSAEFQMTRGELTLINDAGSARTLYGILCDEQIEPPEVGAQPSNVAGRNGSTTGGGVLVDLDDSLVRGAGSLIGLRLGSAADNRIELSVKNSLIAVDGVAVEVSHVPSNQVQRVRNVRLFCDASTFVTRQGFAALDYSELNEPIFGLNRTSNGCVYESESDVSHLVLTGLRQESLYGNLGWLLLKGVDNAYGENTRVLCSCYDRYDQEILALGFNQASQDEWFAELGVERTIRWMSPYSSLPKLQGVAREDFRVIEGAYSPGVQNENTETTF